VLFGKLYITYVHDKYSIVKCAQKYIEQTFLHLHSCFVRQLATVSFYKEITPDLVVKSMLSENFSIVEFNTCTYLNYTHSCLVISIP